MQYLTALLSLPPLAPLQLDTNEWVLFVHKRLPAIKTRPEGEHAHCKTLGMCRGGSSCTCWAGRVVAAGPQQPNSRAATPRPSRPHLTPLPRCSPPYRQAQRAARPAAGAHIQLLQLQQGRRGASAGASRGCRGGRWRQRRLSHLPLLLHRGLEIVLPRRVGSRRLAARRRRRRAVLLLARATHLAA
jgi:hypothetical protein